MADDLFHHLAVPELESANLQAALDHAETYDSFVGAFVAAIKRRKRGK